MARFETFAFRVNPDERRMIEGLAERLQRSQSDAIRWLIREATQEIIGAASAEVPRLEEGSHESGAG